METTADRVKRHTIYLLYGEQGLLYVGITDRDLRRMREHSRDKSWWPGVERIKIRHARSREDALRIERELIEALNPPFNQQHNAGSAMAEKFRERLTRVESEDAKALAARITRLKDKLERQGRTPYPDESKRLAKWISRLNEVEPV